MRSLAPFATLLVTLAAIPVAAQPEPGWGYTWERVGERPINPFGFAFNRAGTLWVACADSLRWLDAAGPAGRWRAVPSGQTGGGRAVLAPGPDTLLQAGIGVIRSTNGGQWFLPRWGPGDHALYEVPGGHPHAGRLLAGAGASTAGAGFSDDRGSTWAFATETIPANSQAAYGFAAPPPGAAPGVPGRVVAAGDWGLWLSDDGGASWRPSAVYAYVRYKGRHVAMLAQPESEGGGARVLGLIDDNVQDPHIRPFYSDDGGETWGEGTGLTEPRGDGLGWPTADALVPLGGSSALALLGRGRIWRTDDGGATWSEVAQAPRLAATTTAGTAVLGPDGRLYVGMRGGGQGWVYRTAEVVGTPVAAEPGPEGSGLRLEVAPNPSSSSLALVLTLERSSSAQVAVYDGLGRAVAVVHDGPLGAGAHRFVVGASALAPGVYLARATTDGATVTARVTITR